MDFTNRGQKGQPIPGTAPRTTTNAERTVSFATAFKFWLKLGFISFGGPAGQIAIMHRELVEERRWLTEARFLHALNYCMLLPGPEAQQLATYIGWLMHRTWGGLVAGGLFVLPSAFLLLGLSYVYAAYGHVPAVVAVLAGLKPVVVAVVAEAVVKIGSRALKRRAHFIIAATAFLAIYFLAVPFPLIVLTAGVTGLIGSRWWPHVFKAPEPKPLGHAGDGAPALAFVIRDDAPPLPHTLPSRRRALLIVVAGILLWTLPFAAVVIVRGWSSVHAEEYRFFTKAALVTFGGAYAVLAYVTQAMVNGYRWITSTQAVDGLALAETTPGPLIMVLQFAGFMAAWNHPQGMSPFESAVLGAALTTYATFLPSFLFIFLGAPYIEVLRGNRSLSGALSGITAAVVGVVLNLALVFGAAVIWNAGFGSQPNWFALVLSLAAFFALYRLKVNVLWVVLAAGLLGLVSQFAR
ncbi:MAG TPA: chromate efflux transporter [Bryobacteraceae bacterium]|nr:chromate efflux transporter [Bryobacteraceae bacterium]